MRVSPWTCIQGREPMEHLQGMIRRIGEAPLKSFQKVHLLKVYAIPRLTYSLVTPTPVSLNRLCALDSLIRTTVKEWLNLPACTTSCLLYCRIRDGGLALPWLTRAIPVAQMKRLQRLMGNRDKVLSTVGKLATVKRHYRQQSQIVKLQGGKSFRKQAFREWMSKGPQGFGVETYQDNPQSHEAISVFAKDLRDYEKQQILKMRANVYPTREFLTRGTTDGCHCRHCGGGTKEDFFHNVTSCSATKQIRIQRHDLVVEILSDFLVQESWEVLKEPKIPATGGWRKPDIVALNRETNVLYVIDPTVVAEGRFEESFRIKEGKYSDSIFLAHLKERFMTDDVRVHGLVLGVRGVLPQKSQELLKALRCSKRVVKKLLNTVLRGTLRCFSHF